jgi:hypothetical protein
VPLDFLENKPGGREKGKGNRLAQNVFRLVRHLEDTHGWDIAPQEEMGINYSYHDVRILSRKVSQWIRTSHKPTEEVVKSTDGPLREFLGLIVDEQRGEVFPRIRPRTTIFH